MPGLRMSTICDASAQLDGTDSSDVPAIVAGVVIMDCAAVLISSALPGDGTVIPARASGDEELFKL